MKNRDDFLGYGYAKVLALMLVLSLGVAGEARAACNNGVDEENKPCGSWDCGAQGSNVTCTLSKGTLTISGKGKMKGYEGGTQPWWNYRNNFTSVKVEEGVTKIGDRAFLNLTNVKKVSLPNSLTSIGDWAFDGMSGVTSLTIPDSVTSIGRLAFYGMSGVTGEVVIPEGVTSIDQYAFGGMSGVTSLIIPDKVDTTKWYNYVLDGFYKDIACLGELEVCYKKLAQYFRKNDANCPDGMNCKCKYGCVNSSKIKAATKKQCVGSYGWNGVGCSRKNEDGSINCAGGYAEYKNECWDVLPFAKKRYTPAEAAQWLYDDNNTVTLTFKKQ